MPDLIVTLPLISIALLAGLAGGWFARGNRIQREKNTINASWREHLQALQSETDRISEQNRSLMSQVSEFRAAKTKIDQQIREFSDALAATSDERDAARRELKAERRQRELAEKKCDELERELSSVGSLDDDESRRDRDRKIFRLSRELESWQSRLPPLLKKFRNRDLEAQQLEIELDKANSRIAELEKRSRTSGETHIEPVADAGIAERLNASNEQYDEDTASPAANGPDPDDSLATYLRNGKVDFEVAAIPDPLAAESADATDELADIFDSSDAAGSGYEPLEAGNASAVDFEAEVTASSGQFAANPDDLQQIKGVGPAIEKTLNRLGIYCYRQIAALNEVEIDRVAQELRGFRSRIYREDWIGQARMLQLEKVSH